MQKAELSRTEVHQLIEQLLNREQVEGHEWVEGRQDPVARLKKQLADKEKALAEEQQGAQAVHAKLVELRAELNGERARQSATQRQLEEQVANKVHTIQVLNNQLQATAELQNKNAHATQMVTSKFCFLLASNNIFSFCSSKISCSRSANLLERLRKKRMRLWKALLRKLILISWRSLIKKYALTGYKNTFY